MEDIIILYHSVYEIFYLVDQILDPGFKVTILYGINI